CSACWSESREGRRQAWPIARGITGLDCGVSSEPHPLNEHLVAAIARLERAEPQSPSDPIRVGSSLTVEMAEQLFIAQCESRHTDFAAKWMQAAGRGFYTIASSGHEGNAGVAAALRPD